MSTKTSLTSVCFCQVHNLCHLWLFWSYRRHTNSELWFHNLAKYIKYDSEKLFLFLCTYSYFILNAELKYNLRHLANIMRQSEVAIIYARKWIWLFTFFSVHFFTDGILYYLMTLLATVNNIPWVRILFAHSSI